MASAQTQVKHELKAKAYNWCKRYLGGSWKRISLDEFHIEVLGGGLTNELYICSLPDDYPTQKTEKRKVVLRIYGALYSELVSTAHALVSDIVVFALLSERNVGPKLYAIFPEGRLEELLPARNLLSTELSHPMNSIKIAKKMAEFHQLDLPLSKEPNFMWDTISGWCDDVENIQFNEPHKAAKLCKVKSIDLRKELNFLRNYLETATSPGPVTFCHNDFQEGNILAVSNAKGICEETCDFQIIDFEYSAYNYRAFDIANHFCEWMLDYTTPQLPYFTVFFNKWPSKEQQLLFIRAYLGKTVTADNNHELSQVTIEEAELLDQVNRFALASHFFWGLWAVLQERFSNENMPFGYLEYAIARLELYHHHKKSLGLIGQAVTFH